MRVVLVGPPGAGKGTQAKFIETQFGIPHISTGDLFRSNIGQGTTLGVKAKEFMDAGKLVPDDITNRMLAARLTEEDTKPGCLLDGYPRNEAQVYTLDGMLAILDTKLDVVLNFVIDETLLASRIAHRAVEEGRSDDTRSVFDRRMREYHDQTAVIGPLFRERGLLTDIDADGTVEDVSERIAQVLRRFQ